MNLAPLFQNGVGAGPERLRFNTTGTFASSVGSGESWVGIVTLDDTVASLPPTFIKMEIEGAELDAIRGGAETIERCQPALAVCVYRAAAHLWEVPLLLHSLVPAYKFHLRRYSIDTWEQLCCAVPPGRAIAL